MVNFVIKKDGSRVPFDAEKLKSSIMAACDDAGVSGEEKNTIVEKVFSLVMTDLENKEEISSTEIKDMALAQLDETAMNVAQAWRKYDQSK